MAGSPTVTKPLLKLVRKLMPASCVITIIERPLDRVVGRIRGLVQLLLDCLHLVLVIFEMALPVRWLLSSP